MFIRSTLVFASLAMPLMAQDVDVVKAASTQGATAMFYKAYFLDNDQASNKEASTRALALYTKFLAANPGHGLAAKAASRAVIILYSTGDIDKARAFAKKHDALITKAEKATETARSNRGGGDQEVSAKLMEAMQTARADGNDVESRRLSAALRRAGGSTRGRGGRGGFGRGGFGRGGGRGGQGGGRGAQGGGRGGFGGGRGARGGRGGRGGGGVSIPKIADMKKEDAQKAVETLVTGMERMIDFMAQRGQADQADKLEAKLDKIQDLVDDGKLAEAQKILDTLEADMGSIGGRGRGGDQGGRRRRGGDGGDAGATGERRRRRGGDGGDAGATGERRRRRG